MMQTRRKSRYRRRLLALALAGLAIGCLGQLRGQGAAYETSTVQRGDVEARVAAIGTLQPRRYVDVGAQVSGQINRLHVQPGAVVEKGQLLVEIDPSVQQATVDAGRASLAGLRAQLKDQQAQHRLAAQQHTRQRRMALDGATRLEAVQEAEAALASASARIDNLRAQIAYMQATLKADEVRLGYTRIYAPMAGTVVSIDAREGQTLNATYQTPNILRIADLSGMTVWTDVSEADVGRVKPGMPVYFTTLGSQGADVARRWESVVRQILPAPPRPEGQNGNEGAANPATATKAVVYTVLFDVDNADGALMPQMTAQAFFQTDSAQNVIVAPLSALVPLPGGQGHYQARVVGRDGQAEIRQVRLGVRNRHVAQINEGLSEGEQLILRETPDQGGMPWFQW
ncbi:efflux RND transporter periplasmic adaptor subunit [Pusillimonas sp. SM2304]|uniref:efflux RND transporter periplasmic adaptor subunit n=1 Tax=Pusillimonas sp. SM2304 TaxID=3073241 RepID=UPI002876569C|nr:efflux RND transporter periplasmic adaptor subunit [Pusillimonas sp. SM2304]MDS1142226.1 efflux RND transporter periplasmic adaptor subunit [Pusillimonas sp. SM2304]